MPIKTENGITIFDYNKQHVSEIEAANLITLLLKTHETNTIARETMQRQIPEPSSSVSFEQSTQEICAHCGRALD